MLRNDSVPVILFKTVITYKPGLESENLSRVEMWIAPSFSLLVDLLVSKWAASFNSLSVSEL